MSLIFTSLAQSLHLAFFPAVKYTLKLLANTSIAGAQLRTYYIKKKPQNKQQTAF